MGRNLSHLVSQHQFCRINKYLNQIKDNRWLDIAKKLGFDENVTRSSFAWSKANSQYLTWVQKPVQSSCSHFVKETWNSECQRNPKVMYYHNQLLSTSWNLSFINKALSTHSTLCYIFTHLIRGNCWLWPDGVIRQWQLDRKQRCEKKDGDTQPKSTNLGQLIS